MGTLAITTTGAQDTRIVAAFGSKLGLPGNATGAQVKADVVNYIKSVVHGYETQQAAIAAADAVTPMPDPT
jgi:hypothetical protein